MSIATRTGDAGHTGLMYNRRVAKSHPRVEAYGSVDELNAALGLARAHSEAPFVRDNLLLVQHDLVTLMGELATGVEDLPRYVKDGFGLVTPELTAKLDRWVAETEPGDVFALFGAEKLEPLKLGPGPPGGLEAFDDKRKEWSPHRQ